MGALIVRYKRSRVLLVLCCVLIGACGLASGLPNNQVGADFESNRLQNAPATRIFDEVYFAYGAGQACHFNFGADPDLGNFTGQDIQRRAQVIGGIVFKLIRDEVERRRLGHSENDEGAWRIFAARSEGDGKRGYDALKINGCEKMRSTVRRALIGILQFKTSD